LLDRFAVFLVGAAAFAALLSAGSVADRQAQGHVERMAAMEARDFELQRALVHGDAAQVEAAALELTSLLDLERDYWRSLGLDAAIGLAEGNRAAAGAIARDADQGDLSAVPAARGALSSSCRTCHRAHGVMSSETQENQRDVHRF